MLPNWPSDIVRARVVVRCQALDRNELDHDVDAVITASIAFASC